jgi:hypothetical protein
VSRRFLEPKKWLTMDVKLSRIYGGVDDLINYCYEHKLIQLQKLLKSGRRIYFNYGLYGACRGAHLGIVKFMIEKGAKCWDLGLNCACDIGHLDVVKLMIEKGATKLNEGFHFACMGGHLDVVKLMIEKGATDWNGGLFGAWSI